MGVVRATLESCGAFSEPQDGHNENPFRLACALTRIWRVATLFDRPRGRDLGIRTPEVNGGREM